MVVDLLVRAPVWVWGLSPCLRVVRSRSRSSGRQCPYPHPNQADTRQRNIRRGLRGQTLKALLRVEFKTCNFLNTCHKKTKIILLKIPDSWQSPQCLEFLLNNWLLTWHWHTSHSGQDRSDWVKQLSASHSSEIHYFKRKDFIFISSLCDVFNPLMLYSIWTNCFYCFFTKRILFQVAHTLKNFLVTLLKGF